MARTCKNCNCSIANRDVAAKLCFPCLHAWGKRSGATKAHARVHAAISKGLLTKASNCLCVDCGKQARDYDHRDYNKPLDVQPVCRRCNKLRGPAIPARTDLKA